MLFQVLHFAPKKQKDCWKRVQEQSERYNMAIEMNN